MLRTVLERHGVSVLLGAAEELATSQTPSASEHEGQEPVDVRVLPIVAVLLPVEGVLEGAIVSELHCDGCDDVGGSLGAGGTGELEREIDCGHDESP
jgi:hypothetical protein